MEKNIDQLKEELAQEIKSLATEILKADSNIILLSTEIKFRLMYEKFINLKFLEKRKIGLDIFDEPIPMPEEKEEIFSISEGRFDDEQVQEYNFDEVQSIELEEDLPDNQPPIIDTDFEENVMDFSEERIEEIENQHKELIEEENLELETTNEAVFIEEILQEEAEEENFDETEETPDIEVEIYTESESEIEFEIEEIPTEPTQEIEPEIEEISISQEKIDPDDFSDLLPPNSNLAPIQLDLNDKFAFQYQLFDGDSESMDLVLKTLNHIDSLDSSEQYIGDLTREMNWQGDKFEYLDRLLELVHKRFE